MKVLFFFFAKKKYIYIYIYQAETFIFKNNYQNQVKLYFQKQ